MAKRELIFVITVILIVFGLSFFQIKDGERKTRDAQRKADVELVARKLGAYYEDHNIYPSAASGLIVSCGMAGSGICAWGEGPMVDAENVEYMDHLPKDPFSEQGRSYVYVPSEARGKFRIYIALERTADPAFKKDLTIACGNHVQCNWYVEN